MPRIFTSVRNLAGQIQAWDRDTKALSLSYASPTGTNNLNDLDVDDTHLYATAATGTSIWKVDKETGVVAASRSISIGGGTETFRGMCIDNTHLFAHSANTFSGVLRLYKLLKSDLSTVGAPLVLAAGNRRSLIIDTSNIYVLRDGVFPESYIDVYTKALVYVTSFRVDNGADIVSCVSIVNDGQVKLYVTRSGSGAYTRVYLTDGTFVSNISPTNINQTAVSYAKYTPGRILGGTTKCFYAEYISGVNNEGLAAVNLSAMGLIGTKFFTNAIMANVSYIYENWYYEEFLNIPTGNVTYVSGGGGRSGGAGGKARRRLIKNQSFGDI